MTDSADGAVDSYTYDADGDKLTEKFATASTSFENATVTYDALDRLSTLQDTGYGASTTASYG